MKKRIWNTLSAGLITLSTVGTADAALIDRGNNLIYDDDLNITWLADARYARTSGYHSEGLLTFTEAESFVNQLTYAGFTDWRLPAAPEDLSTCSMSGSAGRHGFCSGGELNHLFYDEFGGEPNTAIIDHNNGNLNLFDNISIHDWVWTDRVTPYNSGAMYAYTFQFGRMHYVMGSSNLSVLAVHDGDIGTVPIPAAVWLFVTGLVGLAGFGRRNRIKSVQVI